MEKQAFVRIHHAALVSRVTSVLPIADKLFQRNMLSQEVYSKIKVKSKHQNKMKLLLAAVKSGGPEVKSYFFNVLDYYEPFLVKDLEESYSGSFPKSKRYTGSWPISSLHFECLLEIELIRWNQSSEVHRSKLEEFRREQNHKKKGNIYFCRDAKYIIGSGSGGIHVYLGLKKDGTEVAIKRILKNPTNDKDFENELKHLQDLKLESKNIVRYVDFEQDEDFYYLALQLCEYDLEGYMDELRKEEAENKVTALKKVVKEVLLGLQVLHRAKVIHRDIKPKNVLIDSEKNARMADFGLSRRLEDGSTVYTARAGTKCWEAVETLQPTEKTGYKTSSDVQVAGMLVYYLLSDGKHPFEGNNLWDQEFKIREGNYSLDEVDDVVAKDLIERMISKVPEERPTVDEALNHPYFWDDARKDAVLRKLGDIREVQYYMDLETLHNLYQEVKNSDGKEPTVDQIIDRLITSKPKSTPKRKLLDLRKTLTEIVGDNFAKVVNLCDTVKKYNESFSTWKTKLPGNEEIPFPDDLLGLLRFMRNKLVHEKDKFDEINRLNLFPDFFISLHRLAKDLNWDY